MTASPEGSDPSQRAGSDSSPQRAGRGTSASDSPNERVEEAATRPSASVEPSERAEEAATRPSASVETSISIEALATTLVQQAPALDPAVVSTLVEQLRGIGSPLALAIARVTELVGEQLVDPGIALPALAMACATLANPALPAAAYEAARFEIDTLLPMPTDRPGRVTVTIPDVPVAALTRGPRPRT